MQQVVTDPADPRFGLPVSSSSDDIDMDPTSPTFGQPKAATKKEPPSTFGSRLQGTLEAQGRAAGKGLMALKDMATDPSVLTGIGAALATEGASIPVQLLAQGGAGLAGGAIRSAMKDGTVGDMALSGMGDAALNLLPMGVGAGLRKFAQPVMRSALRLSAPIARKFGDVVPTALAERIMPTASGAAKATTLRDATMAANEALLDAAGNRGVRMAPIPIGNEAIDRVQPGINAAFSAGERTNTYAPKIIDNFKNQAAGVGTRGLGVSPRQLNEAKRIWDNEIGNAIVAKKFGLAGAPEVDTATRQALAGTSRDALEQVAPGYKALNRRTMTLEGIRQAAENRNAIPATGLADHLLVFGGLSPSHIAARLAMSPGVKGAGAIGMNELGKAMMSRGGAPTVEMIRAAILQMLQEKQP